MSEQRQRLERQLADLNEEKNQQKADLDKRIHELELQLD